MPTPTELKPFFQFLKQVTRLAAEKLLFPDDLRFLIKERQPHNVWIEKPSYVLATKQHVFNKKTVPVIVLEPNLSKNNNSIQSIDLYFTPQLLDNKVLSEAFGPSIFGFYLPEAPSEFIPESHVAIWQPYGFESSLLIAAQEIRKESTYYPCVRLLFNFSEEKRVKGMEWPRLRNLSKQLSEQLLCDLSWELFFGTVEPAKAPIISMAQEREKRQEKLRQKQKERWIKNETRAFVDDFLQHAFIHLKVTHVHIFKVKEQYHILFRQEREPCYQQSIPIHIERKVIALLKLFFKMDITVKNQYAMDGRYKLEREGDNDIPLKAQVVPGNHEERLIIYREFKEYTLKSAPKNQKNIRTWFLNQWDNRPVYFPLENMSLGRYKKLCVWVEELSQAGFTILLTSKAKLPLPKTGHTLFDYAQFHLNEEYIARIVNIYHFDIHIDIQSIKEPTKFLPKKFWSEFFCTHCYQLFITYRKPKKQVHCPSCGSTNYPAIHNMNSFAFSYYLMSVEGRDKIDKAKSYWMLDDGCECHTYDKNPLL